MLTLRKRGRNFRIRGSVRIGQKIEVVQEHSTGTSSRPLAEAYRVKLEGEIQHRLLHGTAGRASQLSIADAFGLYLERPEGHHRGDIVRIGTLNEFVGEVSVASAIDGWRVFQRGRCVGLKPATVDRYRATLQAALNHAGAHWQMTVPRIPTIRFKNQIVRFLAEDVRDRLLDAYVPHVRPIMTTACYQGPRIGELLRLEWPHITDNRIFFAETKTGKPRTVLMHPRVAIAIGELYRAQGALPPAMCSSTA